MSNNSYSRRDIIRLALTAGIGPLIGSRALAQTVCPVDPGFVSNIDDAVNLLCGVGLEAMPYSPIVVQPYSQLMPLSTPGERRALAPGYRRQDGTLAPAGAIDEWDVRVKRNDQLGTKSVPGPGIGYQDAIGDRPNGAGLPRAGTHQLYPGLTNRWDGRANPVAGSPDPIKYHIRLQVGEHCITNSPVLPIGLVKKSKTAAPVVAPVALPVTVGGVTASITDPILKSGLKTYKLPKSTTYGFNGNFPGPMINAEYGKPVLVRFENDLDINPLCRDRYDYGSPDWAFLTHLHNGHTAPESDGNPHHMTDNGGGYQPGQWSDNLYLGYPAGGDDLEKQSFLWFHDHRMHHTGANVYKGLVGLAPHYDPVLDSGDERTGLRLPGVRRDNPDGSFDVDYDVPMVFGDAALDDAVTPHFDIHQLGANCGALRPEWWGQAFFRHYPSAGFVGDVFTTNGVAYPVMYVEARRYRFRFLGGAVARCFDISLRTAPSGTAANLGTGQTGIGVFPGLQGQWNFASLVKNAITRTTGTVLTGRMLQIAADGGLMERPIYRDSIQIWPAKRREVVIDFTGMTGQTMYLVNSMQMPDGRMPLGPLDKGFDRNYAVPMVKIVVVAPKSGSVDNSDTLANLAKKTLRPLPAMKPVSATPTFDVKRNQPDNPQGIGSAETQWVINGLEFDPRTPLHTVVEDQPEQWTINNTGGGWTHPLHMHQEEHRVLSRGPSTHPHPEDPLSREDVVALDPGETVTVYRNFRTFSGKYVAHCHNLAHEDHNMMFGWTILPKP